MTVTLELTPEEAVHLQTRAKIQGVDAVTALHDLLRLMLPDPDAATGTGTPSETELEILFAELAQGAATRPVLTEGATTRAAIYGDHD